MMFETVGRKLRTSLIKNNKALHKIPSSEPVIETIHLQDEYIDKRRSNQCFHGLLYLKIQCCNHKSSLIIPILS